MLGKRLRDRKNAAARPESGHCFCPAPGGEARAKSRRVRRVVAMALFPCAKASTGPRVRVRLSPAESQWRTRPSGVSPNEPALGTGDDGYRLRVSLT